MSIKYREDSITGIRKREAQQTKIAESSVLIDGSIHLTLPEGHVCDGTTVKFCTPCSCDKVTGGIVIDGETYTVVGPKGDCVTGIGGVWDTGAQLSVVIDQTGHRAFLQNGDPHAMQVPVSSVLAALLSIAKENPNVEDAIEAVTTFAQNGINGLNAVMPKMTYGSYVGSAFSGSGTITQISMTFPIGFKPRVFILTEQPNSKGLYDQLVINYPLPKHNDNPFVHTITWGEDSITLQLSSTYSVTKVNYHWLAIGE